MHRARRRVGVPNAEFVGTRNGQIQEVEVGLFLARFGSILHSPFPADSTLDARLRSRRRRLPAALLCAVLMVIRPSASAQSPPSDAKTTEPPPPVGTPQPFPLVFGLFDLSSAYTFPARVTGGRMSSTFVTGRIAPVIKLSPKLYLSLPLDSSLSFYEFEGSPGLLPGGGAPWDQVRTFAIGVQGRYRVDDHWVLLGEVNVASAGARGAPFETTLSTGATFGAQYRFGPELTLGVLLTFQTRLSRGPFVLPVPSIEWVLPVDNGRWRLVAGGLRVGPGRTAGIGLVYAPVRQLAFNLGIVLVGLGREFRLPRDSPVENGVGRDSALPLLASVDWRPTPQLHVTLWGGVSILRSVAVLDRTGVIVNERDVEPAGLIGGTIALGP
jgi:hypothetical protein